MKRHIYNNDQALKSFQLSSNLTLVILCIFLFNVPLFLLFLLHIAIIYVFVIHNLNINDTKGAPRSSPSIKLVHADP